MKVSIPARATAPATNLFIKLISENEKMFGLKKPVVFILPGGPDADHTAYEKYTCLKNVADLVFHDPRGCGQSDKNDPSTYTMENYIDDIEIIRQNLGLKQIVVLGKSYGSMCAVGLTLKYPKSIDKLILAAGAPSFRFRETAKRNLLRDGTPEQIKACEKMWAGKLESTEEVIEVLTLLAPLYSVKARSQPESFALARSGQGFSHHALNLGMTDFLKKFDYESQLHTIKC